MATEIFTSQEIKLLDGVEVVLRPLPIAKLRRFMRIWNKYISDVEAMVKKAEESKKELDPDKMSDKQYDTFIELCAMGLSELKEERTDEQFIEYLEDTLDDATIYKVLEMTGGLKLGNLNQTENRLEVGMN